MKKKYQSKILQAIHEDAEGMHRLGIINDERMRHYDMECLVQEPKANYKITPVKKKRVHGKPKGDISCGSRISAKSAGV